MSMSKKVSFVSSAFLGSILMLTAAGSALADAPSSSVATANAARRAVTATQPETIYSGDGYGMASIPSGGSLSAVVRATTPDLQTRILDQAGPHDPTVTPPAGPQEVLVLGQTANLTVQVRNAGGGKAENVQLEVWLTGMLDPQQVISANDGFTCSINAPEAHFVSCTGGTLSAGDWNAAASITISVTAEHSGTAVVAATVNPGHTIAESDNDNNQDAQWLTVLPTAIH